MHTVREKRYLPKPVGATKNIYFKSVVFYSAQHNGILLTVGNTRHFHNTKKYSKNNFCPVVVTVHSPNQAL